MLGHVRLRPTVILTVGTLKDGACSPRTVKSGETLVDVRGDTDVQIIHSLCFVLGRKTNRNIRITETQTALSGKADD